MANPLERDFEPLAQLDTRLWEALRGARLLLTGGTGFFGAWLLETLLHAEDRLAIGVEVEVVTRDPAAFRQARPHLANHRAVRLLAGDVVALEPRGASYTHVIHAATPASARLNLEEPRRMFEIIVEGTRRVLEVARQGGARRFLLASSGAVYGRQPPDLSHMPEDYPGAPVPGAPGSAYGEGKRASEALCTRAANEGWLEPVIARGFAFAGPYLPLDSHFAIGNFVRDALRGGPIRVSGDGTTVRSYLYGADLANWLWTLLTRGLAGRAYNVGSERAISIGELAGMVARELGVGAGVEVAQAQVPGRAAERYVPSTRRAREELGLHETVPVELAIRRMAEFNRYVR